jgi:hypothetical protein
MIFMCQVISRVAQLAPWVAGVHAESCAPILRKALVIAVLHRAYAYRYFIANTMTAVQFAFVVVLDQRE